MGTPKTSNRLDTASYEALIRQARERRARYMAVLFSNWVSGVRQFMTVRRPLFISKSSRQTKPANPTAGADAPS